MSPPLPPLTPPLILITRVDADDASGPDGILTVDHDTPTAISFSGNHSLTEGDWVMFVPASEGGCSNAATAGLLSGGPLDASLSVTVRLQTIVPSDKYALCFAEAPDNGTFPGGAPQASDFHHAPHVSLDVVHSPPALPPALPPDIKLHIDDVTDTLDTVRDSNATVSHGKPTTIVFSGNHSLKAGDYVVFVPEHDAGCTNAASAGHLSGGQLSASLSVTVQLEAGIGPVLKYHLCVADEPEGGFPDGHPSPADFEHHPHVNVVVFHAAPPNFPPLAFAPSPSLPSLIQDIDLELTSRDEWHEWWVWVVVGTAAATVCCCCIILAALFRKRRRKEHKEEATEEAPSPEVRIERL